MLKFLFPWQAGGVLRNFLSGHTPAIFKRRKLWEIYPEYTLSTSKVMEG
jgi:hypothetical protein